MKQIKVFLKLTFSLLFVLTCISNTYGQEKINTNTKSDANTPIFEIKNDANQTVFAVYPGGVKIFIEESVAKAAGGGFTVGRLNTGKAAGDDIFSVNPNDVKITFDNQLKAAGGGFTVGRLSTGKAAGEMEHFMQLKKDNYFIGHNSGNLTTGLYNLFLGYESGLANTSGASNTFLGFQSGYTNTTGINNVFIGNQTGFSNLNGNFNTFIGYQAGNKNTGGTESWEGESNTFIGYRAGYNTTTGYRNIAIGYNAGYGFTTNRYNVIIGEQSGYNLSTGQANVWLGTYAGQRNNGSSNIFIGLDAGYNNQLGENNVYIGVGAGRNMEGSDNVFIGNLVGLNMERDNTLLIENSTNITTPLIYGEFDNNRVVINGNAAANPNNYTFYVNGRGGGDYAWNSLSDRKLKKNIITIPNALNKVLSLRGVNFYWKDDETRGNKLQLGFIAQEAMEVIPEIVDNTNNHFSMQYAPITAILVEAVKEQQKQIKELQEKNKVLSQQVSEIDALKAEMNELKTMVKEIVDTKEESKRFSSK